MGSFVGGKSRRGYRRWITQLQGNKGRFVEKGWGTVTLILDREGYRPEVNTYNTGKNMSRLVRQSKRRKKRT